MTYRIGGLVIQVLMWLQQCLTRETDSRHSVRRQRLVPRVAQCDVIEPLMEVARRASLSRAYRRPCRTVADMHLCEPALNGEPVIQSACRASVLPLTLTPCLTSLDGFDADALLAYSDGIEECRSERRRRHRTVACEATSGQG
jgi:hypothetical protein